MITSGAARTMGSTLMRYRVEAGAWVAAVDANGEDLAWLSDKFPAVTAVQADISLPAEADRAADASSGPETEERFR